MQIKNEKVRYWLSLLSLGFMGGTIYILPYIRYVFYDQMIGTMQITNTQIGILSTIYAVMVSLSAIPGAFMADKIDAKKTILVSIGGTTILAFIYAAFVNSYQVAIIIWALLGITTSTAYWPSLIKYINNLGSAESAGNSFGTYYLVNGFSGMLGNVLPLWASTHFGFRGAMICVGVITTVATIRVLLFLESEAAKKARGEVMEGDDENIKISDVKYVLKWPGFYLFYILVIATYFLYANVSYFNPYLINVLGIDPDSSSGFAVVRTYGAMMLAPVGGIMADKVFKSTSKWFIVAFSILAVLFAGTFIFNSESNVIVVCIYSLLPSLVAMPLYSVTYSILREIHFHPALMGTAIGLTSVLPVTDGLVPPIFGRILDSYGNYGYKIIFMVLIGVCVVGVITSFLVRDHSRKCEEGKRVMKIE